MRRTWKRLGAVALSALMLVSVWPSNVVVFGKNVKTEELAEVTSEDQSIRLDSKVEIFWNEDVMMNEEEETAELTTEENDSEASSERGAEDTEASEVEAPDSEASTESPDAEEEIPDGVSNADLSVPKNEEESVAEGDFSYYVSTVDGISTAIINGYTGSDEIVSIPEEIGTYSVTAISDSAFAYNSTLTDVVIPDTVTKIGASAFRRCTNLKSITFGSNLESIGAYAFQESGLESLTLPDSLISCGSDAFGDCESLKSVYIPVKLSSATDIFSGDANLTEVTFGEGITTIPAGIFDYCTGLQTITIPDTVTKIGGKAFRLCTNLKSINFGSNLESIGTYAFQESGLESLTLPDSLISCGSDAFGDCESLKSVYIPAKLSSATDIFSGDANLTEVTFGEGITTIPAGIFDYCTGLESITIPDSVTTIGSRAFYKCLNLKEVELGKELATIGSRAFAYTPLTSITIPENVTELGVGVFDYCDELSVFVLKAEKLQTAIDLFFGGGASLNTLLVAEGVTNIPAKMFRKSNLSTITIDADHLTIGSKAFEGCDSLRNVFISGDYYSISDDAFFTSPNVKFYTSIDSDAFAYAVDNEIAYELTSTTIKDSSEKYLNVAKSKVVTEAYSEVSGYTTIKVEYQAKPSDLSFENAIVTMHIGDAQLVKVEVDGTEVPSVSVDGKLEVVVGKASAEITVVLNTSDVAGEIPVYARVIGDGLPHAETVGVVTIGQSILNISLPTETASKSIEYNGTAPKGCSVTIYVNGVEAQTVTANKLGRYNGRLVLDNPENGKTYRIKVETTYNEETYTKQKTIKYNESSPTLTTFDMYYSTIHYGNNRRVDLLGDNGNAIIYWAPGYGYQFKVEFANGEKVDKVYVVSSKTDGEKWIELSWDEDMNCYYADSFFDPENKSYVPGELSVCFTLQHEEFTLIYDDVEDDYYIPEEERPDKVKNVSSEITTNTETEYKSVITNSEGKSINISSNIYTVNPEDVEASYDDVEGLVTNIGDVPARFSKKADTKGFELFDNNASLALKCAYVVSYGSPVKSGTTGNSGYSNSTYVRVSSRKTADGVQYLSQAYDKETGEYWEQFFDDGIELFDTVRGKSYGDIITGWKACDDIANGNLFDGLDGFASICIDNYDYYCMGINLGKEFFGYTAAYRNIFESNMSEDEKARAYELLDTQFERYVTYAGVNFISSLAQDAGLAMIKGGNPWGAAVWLGATVVSDIADFAYDYYSQFEDKASNPIEAIERFCGMADAYWEHCKKRLKYLIDPSGYVYEGVTTNYLEGVTATIYYKENEEDEPVLWDAQEYEQNNPLLTDGEGFYAWDVPEGLWQVKYELDGYETAYSQWMDVPPEWTDVNIGMKSLSVPDDAWVTCDKSSVKLGFTQYMNPQTVKQIVIKDSEGEEIPYTLIYAQDETDAAGNILADNYTFMFSNYRGTIGENYRITIPTGVLNYCGKACVAETLNVQCEARKDIVTPDSVNVGYADTLLVPVYIRGYENGDSITVDSLSEDIVTADALDIDADGNVNIKMVGKSKGTAIVRVTLNSTSVTADIAVTVTSESDQNIQIDVDATELVINDLELKDKVYDGLGYVLPQGIMWKTTTGQYVNVDYTVTYAGIQKDGTVYAPSQNAPKNAGDYTVTLEVNDEEGEYQGTSIFAFAIKKVDTYVLPTTNYTKKLSDEPFKIAVKKKYSDCKLEFTSKNTSVVKVDSSTGLVTLVGAGTAIVKVYVVETNNYNASSEATVTIVVEDKTPVSKVTLSKTSVELTEGQAVDLKVTVSPGDASDKSVKWSTSDSKVATVSASGHIVAKKAGTAVITVQAQDGSKKKATCKVTVYTQTQSFCARLYSKCLGRTPDSSGIAYWDKKLTNKETTGAAVGYGFVFSDEYKAKKTSDEEYIKMLYVVFMDRNADDAGMKYWKGLLSEGLSREYVYKGFAESAEYTKICASYGIERGSVTLKQARDQNPNLTKFVNRIYVKAMNRAGEENGLNYWCEQIQSKKMTPVAVAKTFIFSDEFKNMKLTDEEYVKVLYRTFMGREYDQAGLQYWLNNMKKGMTREQVLDSFASCPEFKKIIASFGL